MKGTLYVARFDESGRGRWVELGHGSQGLTAAAGFADQADVLVRARAAADHVGATSMDRPEWIAVHPASGEVYCALTNNGARSAERTNAANPRAANVYGHILRWREAGGDAAATSFEWDIFMLCGDPRHPDPTKRGNLRGDVFGSPDGLSFDTQGRLWIATDVSPNALNSGHYAGFGNNQLLCADPASGNVRRFLTGPRGCEITGVVLTPDCRSMFLNIQHPGEGAHASTWPDGGRPRSATVVVRRDDGGVVGS